MIVGTVADPSGAVIASAHVTVKQVGMGLTTSVSANAQGYYVFPSLQPATYDLTVEETGFKKYLQDGGIVNGKSNGDHQHGVASWMGQRGRMVSFLSAHFP